MADEETKEPKEVEVPKKFKDLVESIEKLSVLELSELVHLLEEKFGVSAQAPVMMGGGVPAAAGDGEEAAEEKSSFDVVLTAIGGQKIEVIKVVRDATGKGLKEAKDIVDAVASGAQAVKEGAAKEEAEELKKKLDAAGATVELK
jgi:large subunit ribosomal protein L7/L12